MTTFLWMLYLAFTLLITYYSILGNFMRFKRNLFKREETQLTLMDILSVLLWSIWYFYYLH